MFFAFWKRRALAAAVWCAMAVIAVAGDSPREDGLRQTEGWERFARATHQFRFSGDLPRNKDVTWALTFTDADTQAAFEAAVPDGQKEEFARQMLLDGQKRGDVGAIYALALARLTGVLFKEDLDAALELAAGLKPAWRDYVREAVLWRVAVGERGTLRRGSAAELCEQMLDARRASALETVAHAATAMLKTSERETGRALLRRLVEVASDQPKVLVRAVRGPWAAGDFELTLELAKRVEGLASGDAELRRATGDARTAAALALGRFDEIDPAVIRHRARAALAHTPWWLRGVVLVLLVVAGAGMAWWTRRSGQGPGWWLTACWIGLPMLALNVLLVSAAAAVVVAGGLLFAMLLGMRPETRARYFACPRKIGVVALHTGLIWGALSMVGQGYVWLMGVLGVEIGGQEVALVLVGSGGWDTAARMLVGAVLVPVVEEISFRGFLHDLLGRRLSMIAAVMIGAALFGVMHGLLFALPTALLGAAAIWLRVRHQSLWAPIALHVLNNAMAVAALNWMAR